MDRFTEILKGIKNCECGRDHLVPLKKIIMKADALNELPELISFLGDFSCVSMIADENTYKVASENVFLKINKKLIAEKDDLIIFLIVDGYDQASKYLTETLKAKIIS